MISGSLFFYQNWLTFLLALWLSFLLTKALYFFCDYSIARFTFFVKLTLHIFIF